jgi:hypothetical protein
MPSEEEREMEGIPSEKTTPEKPKSKSDPTGREKGLPPQDENEAEQATPRKNNKKKKKKNMKQSSVVESGEDGQAKLAGSPKKKATKDKSNKEEVKDSKYWEAYEQERRRTNSFRCNFTFHMETPQEGEDRTKNALKLLRQTAKVMGVLDESLVLCPWFELQHVSISPPIKATEIVPSTNMKTYCRKIYDNKRKPGNAKIEISVSTDLDQEEWLIMMGNYVHGQHHTRVYMNNTKGPNSINIGFGVMSTPSSNLQAMGHRLSQASGINIGCRGGKVVLPGEDNKSESVGYAPGLGVQAVQFYSDQSDKDEATSYLNNLLKGKYTNEQMLLCPIMKFVVKPGILTGGNHAKDNAKMRKHQDHFLQNISKMEMLTPITSSLDTIVKTKPGRESNRTLYTLRQMLMMVKNPDPATSEAAPYLLYDVDRVGSSKDMRFIHFKFLEKQVIRAAENILALLQRNFSSAYDFEEHFTLDAIAEARKHPWSKEHGGYAQGKPKSGAVDPRTMLIMCKNNNSDASSCSDDETSDEDDDEDEEERSRGYLPNSVRNQARPHRSILRENLRYKGLHPPGPAGTDEQEKNFQSAKDEDFDAQSVGAQTRVPTADDDNSLGNSTIQTTNTIAPAKQVSFNGKDGEDLQLDAYDEDTKTVVPPSDSVQEIIDVGDDDDSLLSASGLTMATIESQGIDFDVDDEEVPTTEIASMPLENMTLDSNDDLSVLTGNTQGTIGLANNRSLKRPHEVMNEEASMASAKTKTSKTSDNSSPSLDSNMIAAPNEDSPMTDHQNINDEPRQDSNNERADNERTDPPLPNSKPRADSNKASTDGVGG